MYFGKLYYAGIFPFLTNKKVIKPRSNIFIEDSAVSTKTLPGFTIYWTTRARFILRRNRWWSCIVIMPYQYDVVAFGLSLVFWEYLSNNSSSKLFTKGITLVKNSVKPTIFLERVTRMNLWKVVHLIVSAPLLSKCSSFKAKVPSRRNKYI